MVMKSRSKLEPTKKEQKEISFKGVEWLQQEVKRLGFIPLDPSKCEVVIPIMMVNKETTLMITVRDINNDLVCGSSEELRVSVQFFKSGEAISVGPINEVGGGRYNATFTPVRYGDHMISVMVDGCHISYSPNR